jgi:hypothetical protein
MFTHRLQRGSCNHRWVPKSRPWGNPTVRCPGCGQKSEMPKQPSAAIGCLAALLLAVAGMFSTLFR